MKRVRAERRMVVGVLGVVLLFNSLMITIPDYEGRRWCKCGGKASLEACSRVPFQYQMSWWQKDSDEQQYPRCERRRMGEVTWVGNLGG